MEGLPGMLHSHIDSIDFDTNGGLLVAASSLTNRYWYGALFYYKDADKAPNTDSGKCESRQLDTGVAALKSVQDTNKFILGTDTGSVQVWKIDTSEDTKTEKMMCMAEPLEHDDFITSLSINANQCKVVSSSQDSSLKVWDMEEFNCTNTYKAHSDSVSMAAYHHSDANVFASCSQDGSMLLWDTRKAKPATYIDNQFLPSPATCLSWKPDTEHSIAIGTETGEILLQDTRKGVGIPVIKKLHNRKVNNLAFAPYKNDWLATASDDGKAYVLQFHNDKEKEIPIMDQVEHKDFVRGVAWHPKEHKLFTCGWDSNIIATSVKSKENSASDQTCDTPVKFVDLTDLNEKINKIEHMDVIVGATNVET